MTNLFSPKQRVIVLLVLLATPFLLTQCGQRQKKKLPAPPSIEFSRYISAFSGGLLATDESLLIQFAFEMADSSSFGQELDAGLFRIKPSIDGKVMWKDARTLAFVPNEALPADKSFIVDFKLSDLLNVAPEFQTFTFGFFTMPQAANVTVTNIQAYYANQQPMLKVTGVVETADAADPEKVREMIETADGFGETVEIAWAHTNRNRHHTFTIDNINRPAREFSLKLNWDARPVGARQDGEFEATIPEPGELKLIHTHLEELPQPSLSLQFSEPLANQELSGLVWLDDNRIPVTRINGNEILVFPGEEYAGSKILHIESAVTAQNGKRLGEKLVREFFFESMKPAVQLVGTGMILPSTNDLLFPFEAVNLAAVDVSIVRIFEENILQFLQVNQLDGNEQLQRVGRIVAKQTLPLTTSGNVDMNKWNRYAVDLSGVVTPEPGAIYRVIISFSQEYSLYPCGDGNDAMPQPILSAIDSGWQMVSDEVNSWGSYQDYEYYYDYDWNERENPCHGTYYSDQKVSRNILASDLGLIAKKQPDGNMLFVLTDLLTTKPISGATISLYNFQQQLIETITTDSDGFAEIKPAGIPFVAVASQGDQRAYLRVDQGSSLSLSMFDVAGQQLQQGLKGFAYGERGVWRPGDTLFLNFILEDRNNILPDGHPVVFLLLNPQGQMVQSLVNREGVNGFYHFKAITQPDAPTGNYTGRFKVGGNEFTRTLRIETIMPNRLRINTSFENDMLPGFQTISGSLNTEWLHGAAARNLKAEITATLNPAKTTFTGFANYSFDDPTRSFYAETFPIFSGRVNDLGQATLSTTFNLQDRAPGRLLASIETKVFEESGAFSIDRFNIPFHPFKTYAGVEIPASNRWGSMLQTDSTYNFKVVNLNHRGEKISSGKLKVNIYKLEWRWWWNASNEYFGDFSEGSYRRPVFTQLVDINNGSGSFTFKTPHETWGRYLILVTDQESGHRTGSIVYFDWPSWYGAPREGRQQAASMLTFTSDTTHYQTGDDIVVTFPSSDGGRALLSVENGSGILEHRWIKTKQGNTTFEIEATPEMSPNAYIHLTLIQPHETVVNDLPIRLYGVIPVMVEDPQTKLQPVISMPDELKPEQEVTIDVKEKNGKAMTYTLAMVDEGLLDLTRFKTPEPWGHFYAREALGVNTWDMYDYVMGAFGSEFSRLLGIGGDDFIQPPVDGERASRFKPVVRFFGPFELGRNKTGSHTFTLPQYAGSVRVMVVAGNDAAYGNAEKTVPVKQSLMALGTLPRVLGPGESVKFPVNVFALDESIRNVEVTIAANEFFEIIGENKKQVTFNQTGDQMVFFDLKTINATGVARVTATVKSGSETSTFDVELDVRNPNPEYTTAEDMMVNGNQTSELVYSLSGMPDTRRVTLEVSSIPAINLEKRLRYLTSYPYGCTEQLISGAFPQLYLETFLTLTAEDKERIQKNVEKTLQQLSIRQISNGGLSTWPGSTYANEWISSYAGHFAMEAEAAGYSLPQGFISNWIRFQNEMTNRWVPKVESLGSDHMQAYRLFTLAMAGSPNIGAMNRLRLEANMSAQARWHLAAAYELAGQLDAARKLVENVPVPEPSSSYNYYTYGDNLRDKSIVIMVLTRLKKTDEAGFFVKEVAETLASSQWLTTQSTAYGLMALAQFYKGTRQQAGINISYTDDQNQTVNLRSDGLIETQSLSLPGSGNSKKLQIVNKSDNPVFVRVIHSGIPEPGQEEAGSQNLEMNVRFTDLTGSAIDVKSITQGTSFIAEVTVKNPGNRGHYKELALSRIFPSGWEIANSRMDAAAANIKQDNSTWEDFRDDRVYTYFDLDSGQSKTFRVMLTATYEGTFYLPGFITEAMYDASVNARNKGQWINVVR